jgi:hypothetical protein
MTRLVTSLGMAIALTASVPAAQAGSYSFSVGGHRFHVEFLCFDFRSQPAEDG